MKSFKGVQIFAPRWAGKEEYYRDCRIFEVFLKLVDADRVEKGRGPDMVLFDDLEES